MFLWTRPKRVKQAKKKKKKKKIGINNHGILVTL
jgi:hypothetical protein